MRAYTPKKEENFRYPEDMEIILDYLKSHGQLNIKPKTVERYYENFSDEKYCAGWMCIDGEWGRGQGLKEFAEYLSEIEI